MGGLSFEAAMNNTRQKSTLCQAVVTGELDVVAYILQYVDDVNVANPKESNYNTQKTI